jgi:hypothetical protein
MAIAIKCDKCGAELKKGSPNLFRDFYSDPESEKLFNQLEDSMRRRPFQRYVKTPVLCKKCVEGYNKIIDKANKEIKQSLKE